jgi:hypothetical protein
MLACAFALGGCGGDSGSEASGGGTPTPTPASAPPTLVGTPATVMWQGDTYSFAARATDPDGDVLAFEIENRPSWATFDAASGRLHGVPELADVGETLSIRVGVSDGQHRVWLPPFDLTVRAVSHGSVLVTWEAPTENTDDSPLQDLAGFKIYGGTDPDATLTMATVGSGISAYRFDGLTAGVYHFSTTALNSQGLESEPSDVAVMVVR